MSGLLGQAAVPVEDPAFTQCETETQDTVNLLLADAGLKPAPGALIEREYVRLLHVPDTTSDALLEATAEAIPIFETVGDDRSLELVRERDYLPVPDLLRKEVEVTAPVVLVGFGVTAAEQGYDDYRNVDARGKIVVLLTGAPRSFCTTSNRSRRPSWLRSASSA